MNDTQESLSPEQAELLQKLEQKTADVVWEEFAKVGAVYHETDKNFPTEFDDTKIAGVDENYAPLLGLTFDGFVSFLNRPIITDKFERHSDRANWRVQAEKRMKFLDQSDSVNKDRLHVFTETYKSNRLNINSLQEIPGYTGMLLDDPDNLPEGFPIDSLKKINELCKNFTTSAISSKDYINNPNPWDTLPLENTKDKKGQTKLGKLAILRQLESEVLEVVRFLGKN